MRTLQSLACGKYRVLVKHPKSRDVSPTDSFVFNDAFTAPLAKIKIAMVANKVETVEQRGETNEKVDEERRFLTEVRFYYYNQSVCNVQFECSCFKKR